MFVVVEYVGICEHLSNSQSIRSALEMIRLKSIGTQQPIMEYVLYAPKSVTRWAKMNA